MKILASGFLKGVGIALGLGSTAILAVTVSGTMYTFSSGEVVSASRLNTNFASLRAAVESAPDAGMTPPVGTILAWHKNLGPGAPGLPDGWLECNGQTVSDSGSVFDGVVLPDLNSQRRFLRGNGTSGGMEASQFARHTHRNNLIARPEHLNTVYNDLGAGETIIGVQYGGTNHFFNTSANPVRNPHVGFAGSGSETRPINMSVVWIIRVK